MEVIVNNVKSCAIRSYDKNSDANVLHIRLTTHDLVSVFLTKQQLLELNENLQAYTHSIEMEALNV
jgi:hypothetical protein